MEQPVRDRLMRAWARLPSPVRATAHRALDAALRAIAPFRRARLWRPGLAPCGPVVVVGPLRAVLGIGQGARLFSRALKQIGYPVSVVDVTPDFRLAAVLPATGDPSPTEGGVLLTHLNPPELLHWLRRRGMRALQGRRHIGYWAWETETAPAAWAEAFTYVDEVWCPSTFTAEAVRSLPGAVPVHVVPHPVFATEGLEPAPPAADGQVKILAAFDMRSTAARKNPWASIEAFQRANRPNAILTVKIIAGDTDPDALSRLRAKAAASPDRIRLIEQDLQPAEMSRLISGADVVVSLHRSEGFGLLIAEAMWAGHPVLTVGWSGPADFVTQADAALVPYTLVPADGGAGPYAGARWAQADIEVAAERLGALIDDAALRSDLGARSAQAIRDWCGLEAWSGRIRARLAAPAGNA